MSMLPNSVGIPLFGAVSCVPVTPWLCVWCRAEECRTACQQTQGMALFGSKVKLTPLDKDGELGSFKTLHGCLFLVA